MIKRLPWFLLGAVFSVGLSYASHAQSPTPPYVNGDIINYNGSFELSELGTDLTSSNGWNFFFEDDTLDTTFDIIEDAQDDDSRALKVNVIYPGFGDNWYFQALNEPIFVQDGDSVRLSVWLKADKDSALVQVFLGLGEAGGFNTSFTEEIYLTTTWTEYTNAYRVDEFDQEVGMRAGISLNYPENDSASVYVDNLQLEKVDGNTVGVQFSVNTLVQQNLLNFNPAEHEIGLVCEFNEWDTADPIPMNQISDSIFTVTTSLPVSAIGDTIEYKFIITDPSSGLFQWESPDPESPETMGEFSNRFFLVDTDEIIMLATTYYDDIDRANLNTDNFVITPMIDARNSFYGSHINVEGIVTKTTTNWLYLQDETGAIMTFSRAVFSDVNAISFFNAVANGDIKVGDYLKVGGMRTEFNGLQELTRMYAWEIVSSDNPLPEAQLLSLDDVANNGEEFESELVRIEFLQFVDPVDTLFTGYYQVTNEDTTQFAYLGIPGPANSAWANQPNHDEVYFNFNGVVKEEFIESIEGFGYVLVAQDFEDIEEIVPDFDATFSMPSFPALINDTVDVPIELLELGEDAIQGIDFTIYFNPDAVDVTIDQSETLLESLTLTTEFFEGQINIAYASDGAPENDITSIGTFLNLNVALLESGETDIFISEMYINEQPVIDFGSFINIVPRLCGDVTGNDEVTATDASLILQHVVRRPSVYPLEDLDALSADVTGNGRISSFDASWVLQKTVLLRDQLSCISLPIKDVPKKAVADWNLVDTENGVHQVRLDFAGTEFDVYAIELELKTEPSVTFKQIVNVPEGWEFMSNTVDEITYVSLFGVSPIAVKELELEFSNQTKDAVSKIQANVIINESDVPELAEITLGDAPQEFALSQNYPNPFNPSTNISYTLPKMSRVDLTIYNMLGQKVVSLVNQTQEAGSYTINWEAGNVSSGVYIYRLTAGKQTFTKRMMLIK